MFLCRMLGQVYGGTCIYATYVDKLLLCSFYLNWYVCRVSKVSISNVSCKQVWIWSNRIAEISGMVWTCWCFHGQWICGFEDQTHCNDTSWHAYSFQGFNMLRSWSGSWIGVPLKLWWNPIKRPFSSFAGFVWTWGAPNFNRLYLHVTN